MSNGNTRARQSELPMVLGGMLAGALSGFMNMALQWSGLVLMLPGIILGASLSMGAAVIDRRYGPALRGDPAHWPGVLGVALLAGGIPALLIGVGYYLLDPILPPREEWFAEPAWPAAAAALIYALLILPIYHTRWRRDGDHRLITVLCITAAGFAAGGWRMTMLDLADRYVAWGFGFIGGGLSCGAPFAFLWAIDTFIRNGEIGRAAGGRKGRRS